MTRQTSIETYNNIKDNGLLSKRRWQVYDVLFEHGPMTGGEVFKAMQRKYSVMAPANSNVITRLGELRNVGCVEEQGTRVCTISGQRVILWEVTDNLPVKFEKPETRKCPTCNGTGMITEQQAKLF